MQHAKSGSVEVSKGGSTSDTGAHVHAEKKAGAPGFEPGSTDPKSGVLPLHHAPSCPSSMSLYSNMAAAVTQRTVNPSFHRLRMYSGRINVN